MITALESLGHILQRYPLYRKAEQIKKEESEVSGLSRTEILERFRPGAPFTFLLGCASQVMKRTLGIIPYYEQLMCAEALCEGHAAEVKTGEGKTVAIALAAAALSLHGQVHIVTVNDYLACRDAVSMKDFYEFLGLKVGVNRDKEEQEKRKLYAKSDVVYSPGSELIFDYLRDQLRDDPVQKKRDIALVDEVDYVLIDNANSNFTISNSSRKGGPREAEYRVAREVCSPLRGEEIFRRPQTPEEKEKVFEGINVDYVYSLRDRGVSITNKGFRFLERLFGVRDLIEEKYSLFRAVHDTLEANLFYRRDRDYIVKGGQIVLINRENGRVMPRSRLEPGLHLAVEIKEGVEPTPAPFEKQTLSYQVFFSKYRHLAGTSGTVLGARQELEEIYRMPAVSVPETFPNRRIDHPDRITCTEEEKRRQALDTALSVAEHGRPVLLVAGSDEESFYLHNLLPDSQLLNAHNTWEEDKIIKNAGYPGQITVSTNMVGRGTDIIASPEAENNGGLCVISLKKYRNRRIEDQVRGRAGRQGQKGECIFIVSLEDDLFRELTENELETFRQADLSLPSVQEKLRRLMDGLQEKLSRRYFELRARNFEKDWVAENQRLAAMNFKEEWLQEETVSEFAERVLKKGSYPPDPVADSIVENKGSFLLEKVKEKERTFGTELSRNLFLGIVALVVYWEWPYYRNDLEEMKKNPGEVHEYIRETHWMFLAFERKVSLVSLEYFLKAKMEKKEAD